MAARQGNELLMQDDAEIAPVLVSFLRKNEKRCKNLMASHHRGKD
jgi:hypothetical protein